MAVVKENWALEAGVLAAAPSTPNRSACLRFLVAGIVSTQDSAIWMELREAGMTAVNGLVSGATGRATDLGDRSGDSCQMGQHCS